MQPALAQVVLAAMVISMLVAPLVIQFAEPIVLLGMPQRIAIAEEKLLEG